MSIFYIGHEERDQKIIEEMLHKAGYQNVASSTSLDEASQRLGLKQDANNLTVFGVDLVILDILSKTEHIEFLGKLLGTFQYRDVPTIVISDSSTPKFLQMAFAFGATDFIVKPVIEEELVARVRSSLRLKHEIDRRKAREKELMEVTRQLSDINAWLTRVSLIDSLTQVANRRGFDTSLDQEWRRAARNGSRVSLVMIDVDFFKQYNDNYGHRMGDECLREVAAELKKNLHRPGDMVGRYGGEEFAVILADTDGEGTKHVAEKIRASIEKLSIKHGYSSVSDFVTVSCGTATLIPSKKQEPEDLINLADEALYAAKKQGRNRVVAATKKSPTARAKSAS